MKYLIIVFSVLYCIQAAAQQTQPLRDPLLQPEQPQRQEPQGEAPDSLTPNLSLPTNLWSKTSPVKQITLGIVDVIAIGYANQFNDPEFRTAAQKYEKQSRKTKKVQREFEKIQKQRVSEQTDLQEMQVERDNLEKTIATQAENIKKKQFELEKARAILTANEKEAQIARIKTGLENIHVQAIRAHQGPLKTSEDLYRSLSSTESSALRSLTDEYNALREMPDVNQEQKDFIVRNAETSYLTEQDERDQNVTKLRQKGEEITQQTREIENLDAELIEINKGLVIEKQTADLLQKDMLLIGKSKRIKMFGYRIVRVGGRIVFGVDLASRLYYLAVVQEDPGWFPFGTLLQRVAF